MTDDEWATAAAAALSAVFRDCYRGDGSLGSPSIKTMKLVQTALSPLVGEFYRKLSIAEAEAAATTPQQQQPSPI